MDQKIVAAQAAAGDVLIKLSSDIDELKGKKPMSDPNSSDPSSATPEFTSEPLYGMPPNSFSRQTPPPSTVHTAPVGPVPQTSQTGPPRVFAVLTVLTIAARSSAFECVGAILCQHTF